MWRELGGRARQAQPDHSNSTWGPPAIPQDFDLEASLDRVGDPEDEARGSAVDICRSHHDSVLGVSGSG